MKVLKNWIFIVIAALTGTLQACQEEDYFDNGGMADPHFEGSIYDYLIAKPYYFDTVAYIVKQAGLKEVLQHDSVTFFSPTDDAIELAMDFLNSYRYRNVEDSVFLEDISPEIWRYFLSMYILEGKYLARDFARVDENNIDAYPGIEYLMYNDYILNIGLIYQDYQGVEAVGPRILKLTDITFDPENFKANPTTTVASSDIQPENGVVHVLHNDHIFGFRGGEFVHIAEQDLLSKGK